jgi:hypothetical protein
VFDAILRSTSIDEALGLAADFENKAYEDGIELF